MQKKTCLIDFCGWFSKAHRLKWCAPSLNQLWQSLMLIRLLGTPPNHYIRPQCLVTRNKEICQFELLWLVIIGFWLAELWGGPRSMNRKSGILQVNSMDSSQYPGDLPTNLGKTKQKSLVKINMIIHPQHLHRPQWGELLTQIVVQHVWHHINSLWSNRLMIFGLPCLAIPLRRCNAPSRKKTLRNKIKNSRVWLD